MNNRVFFLMVSITLICNSALCSYSLDADIESSIKTGITNAALGVEEDTPTFPYPGYYSIPEILDQIQDALGERAIVIPKGGQTAHNIQNIAYNVAMRCGFNTAGHHFFDYAETNEGIDLGDYARWFALEFVWHVERALEIENINPTPEEVEHIRRQIAELKEVVIAQTAEKYPSIPEELIQWQVDVRFVAFERGPESVLNLNCKKPLSDEQFIQAMNRLIEVKQQFDPSQSDPARGNLGSLPEHFFQNLSPDSPQGRYAAYLRLRPFLREMTAVIRTAYDTLLPNEFSDVSPSDELTVLRDKYGSMLSHIADNQ